MEAEIITRHVELCEYLIKRFDEKPFLKDSVPKKDMLRSLDQEALTAFFSYDKAIGIYVSGGAYTTHSAPKMQSEATSVSFVLGCRNLSGSTASLGTNEHEPGVFDMLESVRELFSNNELEAPIQTEPKRWRTLLSTADMTIIGFEMEITFNRSITLNQGADSDIFGDGYTGEQDNG